MKVICHWPYTDRLTTGKEYEILERRGHLVKIHDDHNKPVTVHLDRFGLPGTERPAWPTTEWMT